MHFKKHLVISLKKQYHSNNLHYVKSSTKYYTPRSLQKNNQYFLLQYIFSNNGFYGLLLQNLNFSYNTKNIYS